MKKIILNKKGLTLIEIILSITIFSIIIVMVTNLYLNFSNFHNKIALNSFENTSIVNFLNGIKYKVDNAQYLMITNKEEILKNKNLGKDYKYICLENQNIIQGNMGNESYSNLLSKNELSNKNFDLIFENINNGLNIKLIIENNQTFDIFINLYNLQNNNNSIKGNNGNAIIYKSNEK